MKIYIKSMTGDIYPLELADKFVDSYRYIMTMLTKNYPQFSGKRIKLFKDDSDISDISIEYNPIKDGDILCMFILTMRKCFINEDKLDIYDEEDTLIESILIEDILNGTIKINKDAEEYVSVCIDSMNRNLLTGSYRIYYE